MSSLLLLTTLVTILAAAAATATQQRHVLWDATDRTPPSFIRGERAASSAIVTFTVPLSGANANVETVLEQISDPLHSLYGQYLTNEQLREQFQAPLSRQQRVEDFFQSHGADCSNILGSSFKCAASVSAIETMFHTKMYNFQHQTSKRTLIRHAGTISVPMPLAGDIVFVEGLGQFMHYDRRQPKAVGIMTPEDGGCGNKGADCFVVPETLRALYNVSDSVQEGSSKTSVGVAEFAGNWHISDSDLKVFGTQIGAKTVPLVINQRGGKPDASSQQASEEAQLDIQYTSGLGDGVENWVWNQDAWMYTFCMELQNTTQRPSVISMSYAWSESDQCSGTTKAKCSSLGVNAQQYVNRTNQEFAKVGLLGITMLSASGDSGCHGRTEGFCILQKNMKPAYPASSPFVTSVGGTMLHDAAPMQYPNTPICTTKTPCASGGVEVVSSPGAAGGEISSGGGFASYSRMPDYQKDVVTKYLNNATAMSFAGGKGTLFNANGRGYPDISALAHKFYIVMGGNTASVDGTSAASPTIAGLVGLMNSQRLKNGKPVLGFFNPLLYTIFNMTNGAAFNDITEGSNACTEEGCWCKTGFAAAPGWDASTGLGTPNVGKMMEAIADLDAKRESRSMMLR